MQNCLDTGNGLSAYLHFRTRLYKCFAYNIVSFCNRNSENQLNRIIISYRKVKIQHDLNGHTDLLATIIWDNSNMCKLTKK